MTRFWYILIVILTFYSCEKDSPSDCAGDKYAFEFNTAAKIDTVTTDNRLFCQIIPGNDIVFNYTHIGPDCKSIADEEYTDKVVFRVPAGSNSFFYQNSQLQDAMCMFIKYAFWTNGANKITSGLIKGTKLSSAKWDVEIDIDAGGSIGRIALKKTFTLQ